MSPGFFRLFSVGVGRINKWAGREGYLREKSQGQYKEKDYKRKAVRLGGAHV